MTSPKSFIDQAVAELDGLHRVLQAWFRAEGEQDQNLVLSHFDTGYTMITTAGKLMTYDALKAALPVMWGSRPGLVMEITLETVIYQDAGSALLTYNERQHFNGAFTDRYSTVLLLDRGAVAGPVWRHLHETMLA